MVENYNQLTPAETERLAILMEECSEVIHICGKILRHGYESFDPADPYTTNKMLLTKELGDVKAATQAMCYDINLGEVAIRASERPGKIAPYLHHQKD